MKLTPNRAPEWLFGGVALLPILYYAVTLVRYAWNMPYMDDYPVLVEFLNRWPGASWAARLDGLLEQNNFHRVVWVKALALLNVGVTDTINFTFLQWVGNAALLLTAWLLYRASSSISRWAFLPALFLIFQFQSWNNAFWAMAAVSNLWAPAWALLALWLGSQSGQRSFWMGVGIGLVALLTNGNGIVVLPLILLMCVTNSAQPVDRVKQAIGLGTITLIALYLYFRGYNNPSGPALSSLLSPEKIGHLLALDTAFLGAMFYHPSVAWVSQVVGGFTIVWTGYLILTRYDRHNPTLFWFLIFLHLTGLMLAVNRIEKGTELMYASRYRNITALMLATTWLTLADVARLARFRWQTALTSLVLAGSVAIWGVSNYTYAGKIVRFRELKQTDQFLWQQVGIIRGCAPTLQPAQALSQLRTNQLFSPAELTIVHLASTPVAVSIPPLGSPAIDYRIDLQQPIGAYRLISGWAKIRGRKANFNDTYLGVRTPNGWQFYSTLFHQRLDLADSVNEKDTGFSAILPAETAGMPVGILVRSGGSTGFVEL
ncbi:hypothetical protein F5984_25085 [Rudanella paleaurantiibacter]|uniref:YfhO family protein n=1 Tax=Rudanella paleaurantiibacter TaxID=2614655 RepID=A0A7J5TSH6_9BACT|nr:hypothetical protein [Rudanella paleaurantiibacter]KAB7726155.1 hypothetical protein F5984_25085 [Rudanella paleaurantiibacter]